ncbi:MAG: hypothetical protein E7A50_09025 [Clostridiales bacterium]|nr:hypothetical protein [Clostridiales bacterium]
MSTIKKLFATTFSTSVLLCSVSFPGLPGRIDDLPAKLPKTVG